MRGMTQVLTDQDLVDAVRCPRCGRDKGEWCVLSEADKNLRQPRPRHPHDERLREAEAAGLDVSLYKSDGYRSRIYDTP